jgi:enoyl-CoA hydratase
MLDLEESGEVAIMRLQHGKVNALDLELLLAITEAMRAVDQARAVVITGSGSVFSAGVDLQLIVAGGPSYVQEFLPALSDSFMAIFDHPGPVVAAVNGHAIAGGCVIAAACDVRLMSQGKIGLAELSVGVPFPPVPMEIMRHAIGPAIGHLALTAALLDPAQAQSIGLIQHVCTAEVLLESAVDWARQMARTPAGVFSVSKRQLQQPARDRIAARSGEDEAVAEMWSSDRTRDAIALYLGALRERTR